MPSKSPPKTIQPESFAKVWQRSYDKHSSPLVPNPMAMGVLAVEQGDLPQVLSLCAEHSGLLSGGSFNGTSMLNAALEHSRHTIAVALLAKGAWATPLPHQTAALSLPLPSEVPFEKALNSLWMTLVLSAPDTLFLDAASAAIAVSGRPFPCQHQWARIAMSCHRFDLAAQIHEIHGIQMEHQTAVIVDDTIRGFLAPYPKAGSHSFKNNMAPHRDSSPWRLIAMAKDHLGPEAVGALWKHAILSHDPSQVNRLAVLGLLPEQWMLPTDYGQVSALGFAAKASKPIFNMLREIPEAVEAALSHPTPAKELACCAPGELAGLARLGVDIGTIDSDGRNFLHIWADDYEVVDGWRTVCKIKPELLDQRDLRGLTPIDVQREYLSGKKLDRFDGLVAGIERASIVKDLKATGEAPAATARKPRL